MTWNSFCKIIWGEGEGEKSQQLLWPFYRRIDRNPPPPTDLFELAVLLLGHDLLHGVPGAYSQRARLDALQGHVGAEREPLVDHLSPLETVQLAAHEHWRTERTREADGEDA